MEPVASRDEIAIQFLVRAGLLAETDVRRTRLDLVHTHVFHVEADLAVRGESRANQVLYDLVLSVDRDAFSAGESGQVDAMTPPKETQLDPPMYQPFALQPVADAGFEHQVDGALLEDAGPHTFFHIFAAASFEHHRLDTFQMQQMREHQSSRPRADDSHLSAMFISERHIFQMHTITCGFGSDPPLRVALFRQK